MVTIEKVASELELLERLMRNCWGVWEGEADDKQ